MFAIKYRNYKKIYTDELIVHTYNCIPKIANHTYIIPHLKIKSIFNYFLLLIRCNKNCRINNICKMHIDFY